VRAPEESARAARVPLGRGLTGCAERNLFLTPKLGGAALFSALVAGQLAAAALIDHFGLMGYPVQPFSSSRALGIALLLAGALLVLRR
jgi:uncharacterized membrane protein YdcZ (DUF606 family)